MDKFIYWGFALFSGILLFDLYREQKEAFQEQRFLSNKNRESLQNMEKLALTISGKVDKIDE